MRTLEPELEGKVSLKQGGQITLMALWKHVDILDWWARHEATFPHMAILARRYLACPETQSFQERVFSLERLFSVCYVFETRKFVIVHVRTTDVFAAQKEVDERVTSPSAKCQCQANRN